MKTLSIIFYIISSILLIASCFVKTVATTWWLGGIALALLIAGCVCQYKSSTTNTYIHTPLNH